SGCVSAYWMGRCISGRPSWALNEPSTNSTSEWTTLEGWITASILEYGRRYSHRASTASNALFTSVAESTVILGPMRQVGCASASDRMDHGFDPRVRKEVQPSSLDRLERLVHQRCGVDGDLGAHAPGWMRERFFRRHARQALLVAISKRASGGGEDQARDILHSLPQQALPDRRMLAVDGSEAIESFAGDSFQCDADQVTARHERFLVGERDGPIRPKGSDYRRQRRHACGGHHHQVDALERGELLEPSFGPTGASTWRSLGLILD